jgi:hypothetical protein
LAGLAQTKACGYQPRGFFRSSLYRFLSPVKGKSLSGLRSQGLANNEPGALADLPVDAADVFADERET